MKPARQLDVSTATDLILRLVPVFQIPVPQDHLKHKEQTANFHLNATFVCVYTCRNSILHGRSTDSACAALLGFHRQVRHWLPTARPCRYLDTRCSNSLLWGFPGLHDARSTTGMQAAVADCGLWLTGKRRKESHWNGPSVSTMRLWDLIWQQLRQSGAFPRCLLVTRQQLSRITATYGRCCVTPEFLKQPHLSAKATHVTGDQRV